LLFREWGRCSGGVVDLLLSRLREFRIGLSVEWGGQILGNKAGVDSM
jgi:hypothetical protein